MRTVLWLVLTISFSACAVPMSSIDPKTVKPQLVKALAPVEMPEGWKQRFVPKRFQEGDVKMLASYVKLDDEARLFVWAEPEGSVPRDLAATLVEVSKRNRGHAMLASAKPPHAAVVLFDPLSGRGGYVIYYLCSNGRVLTLDADFPPEHAEEIIKDIDAIASQMH